MRLKMLSTALPSGAKYFFRVVATMLSKFGLLIGHHSSVIAFQVVLGKLKNVWSGLDGTNKLVTSVTDKSPHFSRIVVVIDHQAGGNFSATLTKSISPRDQQVISFHGNLVRPTNMVNILTCLAVRTCPVWPCSLIELLERLGNVAPGATLQLGTSHRAFFRLALRRLAKSS